MYNVASLLCVLYLIAQDVREFTSFVDFDSVGHVVCLRDVWDSVNSKITCTEIQLFVLII